MTSALLIGGTQFIGRHTVEDLREHDYAVTTFTRGEHPDPFADRAGVDHYEGDRNDRDALEAARDAVDPDVVIDFVGMHPGQIDAATEVFADCDAYVFVSSGSAYDDMTVPLREGETPLNDCSEDEATDDSRASYGPRKAECDRRVFAAAERGVNAMAVRPMLVYGPHDYTERTDYWLHRLRTRDRVLVPGDGDCLFHRAYVEDVASALRIVAEEGAAGEAYNVADRDATWLDRWLRLAAEALGTEVDLVHAGRRELATHDLEPTDFPLFVPFPALAATEKLAALGWTSTPLERAYERTASDHLASERTGDAVGPDDARVAACLDALGE